MLARLVERARRIEGVQAVIVATTDRPADDAIVAFAERAGLPVHRGSETDVLDRVHGAAIRFGASVIVRVTARLPAARSGDRRPRAGPLPRGGGALDYVSNTQPPTFPDGQDTEVFSARRARTAWREARLTSRARARDAVHLEASRPVPAGQRRPRPGPLAPAVDGGRAGRPRVRPGRLPAAGRRAAVRYGRRPRAARTGSRRCSTSTLAHAQRRLCQVAPRRPRGRRRPGGPSMDTPRRLARSEEYFARAEKVIPSATQTFSKGHTQFVRGVAPLFLQRAPGRRVWDVDGNEYIDYAMALGPIVLGYADPDVDGGRAAPARATASPSRCRIRWRSRSPSCSTEIIPCAEMVRFGKNGSDATSGAVRVARAFTGRERVACCGYHGWQDWYIGATTRHRGVPAAVRELTHTVRLQRHRLARGCLRRPPRASSRRHHGAGGRRGAGRRLPRAGGRACTRRHGAVLVFDEIVTGFRFAARRRAGALRRHARPGLLRQGHGQRLSDLGGGRPARHDAGDRRDLLLLHLRRRGARRWRRPRPPSPSCATSPSSRTCGARAGGCRTATTPSRRELKLDGLTAASACRPVRC